MLYASIVIAVLATTLGIHPFVTYPLSLLFAPRRPVRDGGGLGEPPSIAICMSAFNEERVIAAKMDGLLAMAREYPGTASIHVYVDGSTDGTPEALADYADRAAIIFATERRGKSWGMSQLVARSTGDLLLFTDANVLSSPNALAGLARPFADPSVGLARARLRYNNPAESPTSRSGVVYWEVEEKIKRVESDTVGLVGVDGAMFMVRRSLYQPPPPQLIDDLYVSLKVLAQGARVISVDGVTVLERSAALPTEEFARKRRIACQAWNVHRALWPELRRMPILMLYGYISHRVLKWLTPWLLLIAVPAYFAVLAAIIGWAGAILLVALAAVLLLAGNIVRFQPAMMLVSVVCSLAGVGLGLIDSMLMGMTYTIWQPANSVRE